MRIYLGVLGVALMEPLPRKAYTAWANQKQRCNNPNSQGYAYYGAKGIRVEYSSREFVGWFLHSIKKFRGKRASIGRINHDKNYSLDNIMLQDHDENSAEVWQRKGNPRPKIKVSVKKQGEIFGKFDSIKAASKATGVNRGSISRILAGVYTHSGTFTFRKVQK